MGRLHQGMITANRKVTLLLVLMFSAGYGVYWVQSSHVSLALNVAEALEEEEEERAAQQGTTCGRLCKTFVKGFWVRYVRFLFVAGVYLASIAAAAMIALSQCRRDARHSFAAFLVTIVSGILGFFCLLPGSTVLHHRKHHVGARGPQLLWDAKRG